MYVYCYFGKNHEALYVGRTRHMVDRYLQHQREDAWMALAQYIKVWGPYPSQEYARCENSLIAHLCPLYNINMASEAVYQDAAILHQEGDTFDNLNTLKYHFKNLPGETNRCTYHLYNEEIEALRMLRFYCNQPISELVRSLLHQAILEKATEIGHPDILDEACARLMER